MLPLYNYYNFKRNRKQNKVINENIQKKKKTILTNCSENYEANNFCNVISKHDEMCLICSMVNVMTADKKCPYV